MNFDPQTWQLTTPRLRVCGPQPDDGPALNAAICESMSQLQPWMPWAHHAPTLEESVSYAHRAHETFRRAESIETRLWTHEGTLVGSVGLRPRDLGVPSFVLGYWCRSSYAGRGYVSEAVFAIVDYALHQLGAQRLEIFCDVRNKASQRVAEKCGFALEAMLHNEIRDTTGRLCDSYLYARFPHAAQDKPDAAQHKDDCHGENRP